MRDLDKSTKKTNSKLSISSKKEEKKNDKLEQLMKAKKTKSSI